MTIDINLCLPVDFLHCVEHLELAVKKLHEQNSSVTCWLHVFGSVFEAGCCQAYLTVPNTRYLIPGHCVGW